MMKQPLLLTITTFIAAALWGACGGSSSTPAPTPPAAPTVSSITIAGGNAVPSATSLSTSTAVTNVSTSTSDLFTITFSEAMDPTTITTSTVVLACGTTSPVYTVTETSTTVFVVTPTAVLPQQTACTLTIGTGVKNASSIALAAAVTYDFTTGCSTDDTFTNATTIATGKCWAPYVIGTATITPTIASSTSGLTLSTSDDGGIGGGGLQKNFGGANITTSIQITGTSGLISSGGGGSGFCGFVYVNSDFGAGIMVSLTKDSGGAFQVGLSNTNNDTAVKTTSGTVPELETISDSTPLTLTLTRSGQTMSGNYSIGNSSGTLSTVNENPPNTPIDFGSISDTATVIETLIAGTTPASLVECTYRNFTTTATPSSGASATAPNPTGTTGGQD